MRTNRNALRALVLTGAAAALLFSSGVALGCSGNYCRDLSMTQCVYLDQYVQDNCCIAVDTNGTTHCMTAERQCFYCLDSTSDPNQLGGAYNCVDSGVACQ